MEVLLIVVGVVVVLLLIASATGAILAARDLRAVVDMFEAEVAILRADNTRLRDEVEVWKDRYVKYRTTAAKGVGNLRLFIDGDAQEGE